MNFVDLVKDYNLENEATSDTKIYEVCKELNIKILVQSVKDFMNNNYMNKILNIGENTHWVLLTKNND